MASIEQLAEAALRGDALLLRSLTQDWLSAHPRFADTPALRSNEPTVLAVAAGLIELLAERNNQPPPAWAQQIGAVAEPIFLIRSARTMRRLRELCEAESPQPLRRRNLFAPPTFLEFA